MNLDLVTINCEDRTDVDYSKIVEVATELFPITILDGISDKGNIQVPSPVGAVIKGRSYEALLFQELLTKLKKLKGQDPLMGMTKDPVIAVYQFFDRTKFKKSVYMIHDYMDGRIGFVSLFGLESLGYGDLSKLVAHALGHKEGLSHHLEPIDLMYMELVSGYQSIKQAFCPVCVDKLKKKQF